MTPSSNKPTIRERVDVSEQHRNALASVDVTELARELAARMAPDALLDLKDVAAVLSISPNTLYNQSSTIPDFPKAIRLVLSKGKRGVARWRRSDVLEWVERQASGKARGGRPRKTIPL